MKRSFWSVVILSAVLMACGCATHTTSTTSPSQTATSSSAPPPPHTDNAIYTPAVPMPPPNDQAPAPAQ